MTAGTFFAPALLTGQNANFFQFGTNDASLARRAIPCAQRDATLALRGDLNESVSLTLVVLTTVSSVSWNGTPEPLRSFAASPALPAKKT